MEPESRAQAADDPTSGEGPTVDDAHAVAADEGPEDGSRAQDAEAAPDAVGTADEHDAAAAEVPERRPRLWPLYGMVALVGLTLDIATKWEAVERLEPGVPVRVLGPLLSFRLIRNPGAAFSTGEGITWVFAVAAILVLAFVLVRLVPRLGHVGWAVALGLLSAGVAGNLLDRLVRQPGPFRGHVVDFLQLPHWPIFNVADMCITAAAVMVVVLSIVKNVGIDGRRPGEDDAGGTPTGRRARRAARADGGGTTAG